VNGLEREFGEQISFIRLNAADDAEGQAAFEALNGRGHPLLILFTASGIEARRSVGVPQEDDLAQALQGLLTLSGE
jgi:hypothetical protein